MIATLWQLVLVFGRLSFLAIGGGLTILPEMRHLSVDQYHWLTNAQFRDSYSLAKITPGPGMLMAVAIGYKAAGFAGAAVAGVSMFLPTSVLTLFVIHHWDRFAHSPWRRAIQSGLAPVVIGLMAAGSFTLAQTAILGPLTAVIMVLATVALLRTKISPSLLVLAGGIAGWIFLR